MAFLQKRGERRGYGELGRVPTKNVKPPSTLCSLEKSNIWVLQHEDSVSNYDDCFIKRQGIQDTSRGLNLVPLRVQGLPGERFCYKETTHTCLPRLEVLVLSVQYSEIIYIASWSSQPPSKSEKLVSICPVRTEV